MKTLSCSGNESVSLRKGTWRITVKDDIALQFSWYFETESNIQTPLDCFVYTLLTRFIGILTFEIW